jgi:hypothetical protein
MSVSDSSEDLCITVSVNKSNEYYRLINDSFTVTDIKPVKSVPVFKFSGNAAAQVPPTEVYTVMNDLKLSRIENIPLRQTELSADDKDKIMLLLKACADIADFSAADYNIDDLTKRVLYSHKNFSLLSNIPAQTGSSDSVKMCSADFIDDAMNKAFRITPEKPAVNMLTALGYCYNNGFYYYTGGYSAYFCTDVKEIVKAYETADDSMYIIFRDIYTEGSNAPFSEYSTAAVEKDNDGFYLTELHMGGSLDDIENLSSADTVSKTPDIFTKYLPLLAGLLALALIGAVVYFFIL